MRRLPVSLAALLLACGGSQPTPPMANSDSSDAHHHGHHADGHHGPHGEGHAHGAHHGPGHHHDFSDVERFAARFDDPARDAWQRPAEIVGLLELRAGAIVADIGAGTGYFAVRVAPEVGPSGRVLALDVEPRMVEHMRARAAQAGFAQVQPRVVQPGDPGLAAASVDRILIVDTWHHLDDRTAYGERLRTALRPGGFVLVVDFTEDSPEGPPASARLSADAVVAELTSSGFRARVLEESLPYQYVVRADLP